MSATPILTVVTFGDRFLVESDQYKPDPSLPGNAQRCLLLTSRSTLAKSGDSWATRKAAEAAVERFNAKRRTPKPCIGHAEAARLVAAYEPISLILAVMEAAKSAGWPHGFVIMETNAGNTATLTTTGGLTKTMRRDIRESLKGDSK